jgi:hypothetical protein
MRHHSYRHLSSRAVAISALGVGALVALPAAPAVATPPAGPTAYASAMITPAGGAVSGFGVTASFAAGAVSGPSLAILTNGPNGLDLASPTGPVLKTFGLQICPLSSTGAVGTCSNVMGNYPDALASGTERVGDHTLTYGPYVGNTTTGGPGITFGSATNKLVTITVNTGGSKVYIYNPNATTTARAYPVLLPSTSSSGVLTFATFQPIVWAVTTATP